MRINASYTKCILPKYHTDISHNKVDMNLKHYNIEKWTHNYL